MSEANIHSFPLFLGLTRPPMYAGVTLTFFIINALCNEILFILTSQLSMLFVLFPVLHGIGYIFCRFDPHFFDLIIGKLQCLRCKNTHYWGCNSYDPY